MNNEYVEKEGFIPPRSQLLFSRSAKYCALHEASEVQRLPRGIIIMSQIEFNDSFTKRDFQPFQNVVQVHQILRLPHKMTAKSTSHFDACQRFSNVQKVPRLPHEMDTAEKTSTAR